ncbi:alpha-amylase family glycosyl hydrolase [Cytobacillus sp. Hz8]|uniref:alpha-amylase family glycosyl hydrolase n=1 Tax=Cytobacillus sp. Hz8 TaxID=3347168 RepID=UPI0035E0122D
MRRSVLTFILIPLLLFYCLPVEAAEKEARDWQDETIYYISVDRFNNSDQTNDFNVNTKDPAKYHGGDFQGVIDQLDYLHDMGFTTINLSPIFESKKNDFQGYSIRDFYKTNEHFGSLKTFKKLVKEAHKRNMKVMIDFVTNNVALNHPWLNDSTKKAWFHEEKAIRNSSDQQDLEKGWVNGLPDLNQNNQEVKKYLIDCAKWWIEETDIDGYRLNQMNYVPLSFWKDFVKEVKTIKSNVYLLGDVQSKDTNYLKSYQDSGIDGLLDFPLNPPLREAFAEPDQSLDKVLEMDKEQMTSIQNSMRMGTFMDTPETVRFTRDAVILNQHPGPRWKLALTYLYTTPGVPVVYYGSEIALDGGKGADGQNQMDFRTDQELVEYITKLVEVRKQLPSLANGTFKVLYSKDGMAVYKREFKGETSIIALNNTTKTQKVTLTDNELAADKELRGLLAGDLVKSKNNEYNIILDRDKAEIYVLAEKSGLNYQYIVAMGLVYLLFIVFIVVIWKRSKRKRA